MGQDVQRPVVAEGLVEGRREDQHVGGQHAAGMVGDDQCSADGGHIREILDVRPEIAGDDRPDQLADAARDRRIPLRDLAVLVAHGTPCSRHAGRVIQRTDPDALS